MDKLKEEIINYLYMGLCGTVVGFYDDGLFYLFEKLLKGRINSSGYDPVISFVHVAISPIAELTAGEIENAINQELKYDNYKGDTITETLVNGVDIVACVIDDLLFIENVPKAIEYCDSLIRKYRQKLLFVYVAEDPLIFEKTKGQIPATSSFYDTQIHQEIGKSWSIKELQRIFKEQFKAEISQEDLETIAKESYMHYGIFKRLYKDKLLKTDSIPRYVSLLAENFSPQVLNVLKKLQKNFPLEKPEQEIVDFYRKVNFVSDNQITIPIFDKIIKESFVPNKISLEGGNLVGIDLQLLTEKERKIIKALLSTNHPLPKEELGKIIWENQIETKYSIWAIDQRIARLRRKMIDLGFNLDIQTIYGKGFTLVRIPQK